MEFFVSHCPFLGRRRSGGKVCKTVWYPQRLRQVARDTADALTQLISSKPASLLTPAQLRTVAFYRGQGGALDVLAQEEEPDISKESLIDLENNVAEVMPWPGSAERKLETPKVNRLTSTPLKAKGEDHPAAALREALRVDVARRDLGRELSPMAVSPSPAAGRLDLPSHYQPTLTLREALLNVAANGISGVRNQRELSTGSSSPPSSPEASDTSAWPAQKDPYDYFDRLGQRVGQHVTDFGGWFPYADHAMSAKEAKRLGYCGP